MEVRNNSMVFFADFLDIIDAFETEEEKNIFQRAILEYGIYNTIPDLQKGMKAAFIAVKSRIDGATNKYNNLIAHKKEAGRNGALKRWGNTTEEERPTKYTKEQESNFKDVQEIWNTIQDTNINKVVRLSDDRKFSLFKLLKIYNLMDFKKVVENINNSEYLRGKNKNYWCVNFDWIIKESNFIKVLENNYSTKENNEKSVNEIWK